MHVRERLTLSSLTTFHIGGPARFVLEVDDVRELGEAVAFAKKEGLPFRALGSGSNVLADEGGYDGVLIRITAGRIELKDDGDDTLLTAEAGALWDDLVKTACANGLWGIENLAGIPGTAGAAPMQNIGAYGAELRDVLVSVETFDGGTGERHTFRNDECEFGYRTSRFKAEPYRIIAGITLRLKRTPQPRLAYKDLAALVALGEKLETPGAIAEAVRGIRAKKFPDVKVLGTAGSFFKNPVIPEGAFASLEKRYPGIPGFPDGKGGVKVPLAWILDNVLHARGRTHGKARLFEAQPLVIVAEHGATSREVIELARSVEDDVHAATGIRIEWEARRLP
jgi:UDP-N-acetylmuramate dehydrogenase